MKVVKLSDVVVRANTKEDRKTTTRIYYAAGEQVEPQELLVRRKGIIAEADLGPMFYFGFKSGQVLLPSRSFESKKAAVATYDGICSEKTFVLETKDPNVLLQEYLVFIIQNELFWQYAEENKSGSVNFFLNWSAIANYEFTLPSLSEQKVLADKLWAAYRVKESYKKLLAATDDMLKAKFMEMFGEEETWEREKIGDIMMVERGGSPRPIQNYITTEADGLNWIKIGDAIEGSKYITSTKEKIKPEGLKKTRFVHKGDFILSNSMSFGRPYILEIDGCIHDGWLVLRDENKCFDKLFLYYYLSSPKIVDEFKKLAIGGVVHNLNCDKVRNIIIAIPPLPLQQKFAEIATQAEATKESLRKSIENIDQVIKSLINQ